MGRKRKKKLVPRTNSILSVFRVSKGDKGIGRAARRELNFYF